MATADPRPPLNSWNIYTIYILFFSHSLAQGLSRQVGKTQPSSPPAPQPPSTALHVIIIPATYECATRGVAKWKMEKGKWKIGGARQTSFSAILYFPPSTTAICMCAPLALALALAWPGSFAPFAVSEFIIKYFVCNSHLDLDLDPLPSALAAFELQNSR